MCSPCCRSCPFPKRFTFSVRVSSANAKRKRTATAHCRGCSFFGGGLCAGGGGCLCIGGPVCGGLPPPGGLFIGGVFGPLLIGVLLLMGVLGLIVFPAGGGADLPGNGGTFRLAVRG